MSIILYAGGNIFFKFLIDRFVYAKFSFLSFIVLMIAEYITKTKGKEKENTNNKDISCLNLIIGFLIKSSPHNPHTNFP